MLTINGNLLQQSCRNSSGVSALARESGKVKGPDETASGDWGAYVDAYIHRHKSNVNP